MPRPSVRQCLLGLVFASICYAFFFQATPDDTDLGPAQFASRGRRGPLLRRLKNGQLPFSGINSRLGTKASQRIVAVGDVHGDLAHLTRILRSAGLIDLKSAWVGGEAILVQTGDIVDRGKDTIAIYRFFDVLRPQAAAAGGRVWNLLGNHELMNAFGDWRYVTKEDIDTFGGVEARKRAISTGWIGQTWRANYSITARVPIEYADIPTGWNSAASFVHGGITPSYIKSLHAKQPVDKINDIGLGLLESLVQLANPLQLPRNATQEQREFWSERGPMWDRTYALDEDEAAVCARAEEAADLLGVRHLVMGHTPFFEGIQQRCDGLVLLIDTGISRAYGGAISALEILTEWTKEEMGWREVETSTALYTDHRDKEVLAQKQRMLHS